MNRFSMVFLLLCPSLVIFGQDTLNITDSNGRKQGFWRKSDSSGNKIYEGQFRDGIPYGAFRYYYPNGKLKTLSVLSGNSKSARTISYYPNGMKMAAGNYINEKKDSIWQFFNESDGSLVSEEQYHMGQKSGSSKTFYSMGGIAESSEWKEGVRDGPWTGYYPGGQVRFSGFYKNNEKTGLFEAFYDSSKPMITGQYSMGHQNGVWVYYNEKGEITKKETYENGILRVLKN